MTYPDDLWTGVVWRSVGKTERKEQTVNELKEKRKNLGYLRTFLFVLQSKSGLYNHDTTNIKTVIRPDLKM